MMRTKHLIAAVVGCGLFGLVGLAEAARKKKTEAAPKEQEDAFFAQLTQDGWTATSSQTDLIQAGHLYEASTMRLLVPDCVEADALKGSYRTTQMESTAARFVSPVVDVGPVTAGATAAATTYKLSSVADTQKAEIPEIDFQLSDRCRQFLAQKQATGANLSDWIVLEATLSAYVTDVLCTTKEAAFEVRFILSVGGEIGQSQACKQVSQGEGVIAYKGHLALELLSSSLSGAQVSKPKTDGVPRDKNLTVDFRTYVESYVYMDGRMEWVAASELGRSLPLSRPPPDLEQAKKLVWNGRPSCNDGIQDDCIWHVYDPVSIQGHFSREASRMRDQIEHLHLFGIDDQSIKGKGGVGVVLEQWNGNLSLMGHTDMEGFFQVADLNNDGFDDLIVYRSEMAQGYIWVTARVATVRRETWTEIDGFGMVLSDSSGSGSGDNRALAVVYSFDIEAMNPLTTAKISYYWCKGSPSDEGVQWNPIAEEELRKFCQSSDWFGCLPYK
jgi:hypothetical protein